ncbi:MAG: relaxase domain-containing protein [Hyphomonas sp.]|nr:relaxase domain-containing protein [Hyphomonas sp.]
MVASISARKSVGAAVAYFKHMAQDEYYTKETEADAESDWDGRGSERLALDGDVTRKDFEALLNGYDPKTAEPLVQTGNKSHAPGWDMTYSAPKSVSVLWALSAPVERAKIEAAHRQAVSVATKHLEDNHAFTRRGKGGATREPVAGLTIARYHHHTSRDLDPQLHTHAFIFNAAPRRDGTWGTLISRELYKAQKETGAAYRAHLANALERDGHVIDRIGESFRIRAIPHHVERAFSKRRMAIEEAAKTHGYRTPKGMELAALRTRQAKRPRERAALFQAWSQEARALGFKLPERQQQYQPGRSVQAAVPCQKTTTSSASPSQSLQRLLMTAALAFRSSSGMSGLSVLLRRPDRERDLEAER